MVVTGVVAAESYIGVPRDSDIGGCVFECDVESVGSVVGVCSVVDSGSEAYVGYGSIHDNAVFTVVSL